MAEHAMRVSKHGRRQLELQITLPISSTLSVEDFELDLYIYTPAQLGLTEQRYGVKSFLEDIIAFTRQTPLAIPLDKLCDPACTISPLVRLRQMLAGAPIGNAVDIEAVSYELRTFVNAYHGQLHTTVRLLAEELAAGREPATVESRVRTLLGDIDRVLTAYREIFNTVLQPHVPPRVRTEAGWGDQALSLNTQKQCAQLYVLLRRRRHFSATLMADIARCIEREQNYCRDNGYQIVTMGQAAHHNDLCVYIGNLLKKWAQSAMYMSMRPSTRARKVAQVLAAVAAGVAMAFAMGITFVAERYLRLATFTLPWAMLIVGAYAFKDRIKETLRAVLLAAVPRLVADDVMLLVDPRAGCRVGWSRLRVRFCNSGDVPEAVDNLRDLKGNPFRAVIPAENVIHVNRRTRIHCATIRHHHHRLESLTNIVRIKLDRWLSGMDDPYEVHYVVHDGKMRGIRCRRVYHVNLIARITRSSNAHLRQWHKYRITLTRDGVVEIHKVESLGNSQP